MNNETLGRRAYMKRLFISLWLLCWFGLIIFGFASDQRDADVVVFVGMLGLSFPVGWIAIYSIRLIYELGLSPSFLQGNLGFVILISVLVCIGYVQWFIFLPKLVNFIFISVDIKYRDCKPPETE